MTETITHTPGPWQTRKPDGDEIAVVAASGACVAQVNGFPRTAQYVGCGTEHPMANASLIAAAPDLLFYAKAILQDGNIEQLVVGAQGARVPFTYAKLDAIITGLQAAIDKADPCPF